MNPNSRQPVKADNHAARTDAVVQAALVSDAIRDFVPVKARGMDPLVRDQIDPHVRDCVQRCGPKTVGMAYKMLRYTFGVFDWALTKFGTVDTDTVFHPDNIALYSSEVAAQVSVSYQRDVCWILGQIGRAVAAHHWPRERPRLPKTGPAVPYTLDEEIVFRRAVNRRTEATRTASAVVVALALGAGLSAKEIHAAKLSDVVWLCDGRLGVWVTRPGRPARLVPVRSAYIDMLNDVVEDSNGERLIVRNHKNAIHAVAARLEAPGIGGLRLTRARSTWLRVHLLAGTPLPALRVIAGPVSLNTLTELFSPAVRNIDPETAALQGLRP